MEFEIKHCSVLDTDAEIIVNAANSYLSCGGGVCEAIFAKAGDLELEEECKEWGFVPTGSVAITNGLKTGAKYIIHAVGPNIYIDKNDWQKKLASAYRNSLVIADDTGVKSIAFPCISTGIFGCPLNESTHIALNEIVNFQAKNIEKCYLCCYTEEEYAVYKNLSYLYTFSNFTELVKLSMQTNKTQDDRNRIDQFLSDMINFKWEDLILIPKESLIHIPISWMYDWIHCTANYDKQDLVKELYNKHNLPILVGQRYLNTMTNSKL